MMLTTTNLIVKVKRYHNDPLQPYFSFYNKPAIADDKEARKIAQKLNELTKLEDKSNDYIIEYYSVPMGLNPCKK